MLTIAIIQKDLSVQTLLDMLVILLNVMLKIANIQRDLSVQTILALLMIFQKVIENNFNVLFYAYYFFLLFGI